MNNKDYSVRANKVEQEMNRILELMNSPKKQLNESSLSRVWRHSEEYDIATISAFRNMNVNCLNYSGDFEEGHEFSYKENKERNKDLLAVLLQKGYGVTKIMGNYIENFNTESAVEVGEESFFVVNKNMDEDFFPTLIKLAKYFCQDSVLLKPQGQDAYLYGTNSSEFPGLDNRIDLGSFRGGKEAEFLSRVGKSKRPFFFAEDYNVSSRHLISTRAKRVLSQI
jgi:hypothetical protein